MNRISSFLLAGAVALLLSPAAQAATISIAGDTGGPFPIGTTGQLQIIIDIAPENNTFTNGGLSLTVGNSQPGVIAFTDAQVENPDLFGTDRWSVATATDITPDQVGELFAASISTQALNPAFPGNPIVNGGTEFLFATIDYTIVGGGGASVQVGISSRPDPIISQGADVSNTIDFVASAPIIGVPEPASFALLGLGLVSLGLVRRRS